MLKNITFIILRYVSNQNQNYWIHCYNSIRKFYDNKIIIIDSTENKEYITKDITLINTEIIENEYKGSGEISPYYYFYKYHWTDKIIFIHDSTILLSKFNDEKINLINNISFLWCFKNKSPNKELLKNKISLLNNSNELLHTLRSKRYLGSFGCMSCITFDFLKKLNEKYNFLNLINYTKTKQDRILFERILGICSYSLIKNNNYIFCSIYDMPFAFKFYYSDLVSSKKINRWKQKANLLKFWSGR